MNKMLPAASAAFSVQTLRISRALDNYPDSFAAELNVCVQGPATLADAIQTGARHTSEEMRLLMINKCDDFPSTAKGWVQKEIMLYAFGTFLKDRSLKMATALFHKHTGLVASDVHTALAVTGQYNELCRELGRKHLRLVSLLHTTAHYGLGHVPVLYQDDVGDTVSTSLKLEPLRYGWSAHHCFVFERAQHVL